MRLFRHTSLIVLLTIFTTIVAPAQENPELVTPVGHLDSVLALAISPDSKYLASAGIDRTIIIWDLGLRRKLYSLKGHSQWITSLDFSPNRKLLASGSADGTVKLWNIYKGIVEYEIPLKTSVSQAVFSPAGDTLAIIANDNVIKLWDVPGHKLKAELNAHTKAVQHIAFSPDSKKLASSGEDQELILWNLSTMKPDLQTKHQARVESIAYSPTGAFVAVGTIDGGVGFWNVQSGKLEMKGPAQKLGVEALSFVSDKEMTYLAGSNAWLWNLETNVAKSIGESNSGKGSEAIVVSKDKGLVVFNDGQHIKLFDLNSNQATEMKGGFSSIHGVTFSRDVNYLYGAVGNNLMAWGDGFGVEDKEKASMMTHLLGRRFAYISSGNVIARVPEIEGGYGSTDVEFLKLDEKAKTYPVLKAHAKSIESIAASSNGTHFATSSEDGTVKIWELGNATPLRVLPESADNVVYSPDGKILATSGNGNVKLWNTENWQFRVIAKQYGKLRFSPDNKKLAVITSDEVTIIDVATGASLNPLSFNSTPKNFRPMTSNLQGIHTLFAEIANVFEIPLSFSNDSKLVACEERNAATGIYRVKVWDADTGDEKFALTGHSAAIPSTSFSPKGTVLVSGSWDTTVKLWSTKTGRELATIAPLDKDHWVIYMPDGRFDTNVDLEEGDTLHWSMPGNALTPLPLDTFRRDYHEPKLFQRLMDCADTDTCDSIEFKKIRDLSELNIVRPQVAITDVSLPDADGNVEVMVEVAQGSGMIEKPDGRQVRRQTGVYDLRVFRDGQLVGVAPADGAEKLKAQDADPGNSETALKVWRDASEVKVNPATGKQTLSFKTKLPRGKDNSSIKFTAYAFNDDRVKSPTMTFAWKAEQRAQMPKASPNVTRRAYILSVGVSKSNLSDWNLNHGADDAYQFQKVVPEKLRRVGTYEVIPIELVSDQKDGKLIDNATKQIIKAVFDLLAGRGISMETQQKIPNYQQIRPAMPDDFVLVTFSTHGYSAKNSDFYLFPSDITQANANQTIPDLRSMISGEELSIWLRDVDAGEIAIIIDACQSAAAVESFNFKPGPLGSRGLGQLAYDKRMSILAATQASNDALEIVDGKINQGLLSYALVQEGFSHPDVAQDGKIMLKRWLEFGESRVPRLYEDVLKLKVRGVVWKRNGKLVKRGDGTYSQVQRASLFNFSRQNGEIVIAYIEPVVQKP